MAKARTAQRPVLSRGEFEAYVEDVDRVCRRLGYEAESAHPHLRAERARELERTRVSMLETAQLGMLDARVQVTDQHPLDVRCPSV